MSSIRLFILSSFAEHGPMHGHLLRSIAEKMKVPLWTDISVGAVYGAMKRLAAEGLLREAGREQQGKRPTRQVYEITEEGRRVLDRLRLEGLNDIWFKPDPFDLALTRIDAKLLKTLPQILARRLETVKAMLAERRRISTEARAHAGPAKQWVLKHSEYRLEAEARYLSDLLKNLDGIAASTALLGRGKKAS